MANRFDGHDLRAIRLALGLTQSEFAKGLGVSRVHVGLMERGQKAITDRTRLAALGLRPKPLDQKPREFDPIFREIELALIANGEDFVPQFRSGGQLFDFFLPLHEIAICIERDFAREVRPTEHVRGIITVTGKSAAELLALILNGRPMRAAHSPFVKIEVEGSRRMVREGIATT